MTQPLGREVARRPYKRAIKLSGWGKAQKMWNSKMTREDKRKILEGLCKASTQQIHLAIDLPWSSLSRWMRMSIKRYFRKYEKTGPFHPAEKEKK